MENNFLKPLDTKAILDLVQYFNELFRTNPPSFFENVQIEKNTYLCCLISLLVNDTL